MPAVPEALPAPLAALVLPGRLPAGLPPAARAGLAAALAGPVPSGRQQQPGELVRAAGQACWDEREYARLRGFLETVDDPRDPRGRVYPLSYLLALLMAGMAGDDETEAAAEWTASAPEERSRPGSGAGKPNLIGVLEATVPSPHDRPQRQTVLRPRRDQAEYGVTGSTPRSSPPSPAPPATVHQPARDARLDGPPGTRHPEPVTASAGARAAHLSPQTRPVTTHSHLPPQFRGNPAPPRPGDCLVRSFSLAWAEGGGADRQSCLTTGI